MYKKRERKKERARKKFEKIWMHEEKMIVNYYPLQQMKSKTGSITILWSANLGGLQLLAHASVVSWQ